MKLLFQHSVPKTLLSSFALLNCLCMITSLDKNYLILPLENLCLNSVSEVFWQKKLFFNLEIFSFDYELVSSCSYFLFLYI